MKMFLVALILLIAAPLHATSLSKISFSPYSSQSSVTCNVFGYDKLVFTDANGTHPMQGATLDPDFARTLILGTKTMKNYSTTLGGKKVRGATFTCTVTGTNTMVKVKVGTNGSVAIPLTLDSYNFILKESL